MGQVRDKASFGRLPMTFKLSEQVAIVPTGVRDYIHVVDLAKGHIAALKKLKESCGRKVRKCKRQKRFAVIAFEHASHTDMPANCVFVVFRFTTWEQGEATLCCRWSKPWKKLLGGR